MGISTKYFKEETKKYIIQNYNPNVSILDIGAGSGTYYNLLNFYGYNNIDAVEVFEPYIERFNLRKKYNQVYFGDITELDIDFEKYDLVILGDVFEHIEKEKADKLIQKIYKQNIILSIPFQSPQGAINDNIYEIHLQDNLRFVDFLEENKIFNPLCVRFDYGVFINNSNYEKIYIESAERQLPREYYDYIISKFNNKIIEVI